MPSSDIAFLQEAIRAVHGCESTHVETVPVTEVFKGQVAWDGEVEVFRLKNHPKADRCFAWAHEESGVRRATAVLEIPPVDGPETAVKAAVAASARPGIFKS